MTDRYSLSDRQIYGAEDDFEMDMIFAAIDRAHEEPKPAAAPKLKAKASAAPKTTEPPPAVRAPAETPSCTKTPYRTQAAARQALAQWKTARPDDPKLPRRVYPCDRCDAWHLTRKLSGRRVPPWDRNPHWERPVSQLAMLQPRFKR